MPRVLIVEDEPNIALPLEDDLRLEGYDVDVTGEGGEAIRRARGGHFDLIVLDVMLIGKDGFEVCRELRRTGVTTPILMLTARTAEAEKVLAFESGADDYVTKPFGVRELRARIAALLRRAGADRAMPALRVGEAEIDFGRGEVRLNGRATELTPIEFKLLQILARAHGRIVTRDQLISEAWGPGAALSDRALDNHIGGLRRKIESNPGAPQYLKNVRGLGYRLES